MSAITIRGVINTTVLAAGEVVTVEHTGAIDRLIRSGYAEIVPGPDGSEAAGEPDTPQEDTNAPEEPEAAQEPPSVPEDDTEPGVSVPDEKPKTVKRSPRRRK